MGDEGLLSTQTETLLIQFGTNVIMIYFMREKTERDITLKLIHWFNMS